MSFMPHEYVRHILVEAEYLVTHSSDVGAEQFLSDETLRRAFVRGMEVIGEAASKLPQEFRAQHPQGRLAGEDRVA